MARRNSSNRKSEVRSTKPKTSSRKPRSQKNDTTSYAADLKDQEEKKDYNNRPSMYFSDATLMDQATSISFGQFLPENGKPFESAQYADAVIPSIMVLYYNPSCGYTRGVSPADSGINIAGMKIYNKSSSLNAKTTQYAPQDDSTLMLAIGDIIGRFAHIRRFFQLAFLYNKRNWNVPRKLMEAMGLDVEDFFKNLADYRLQFNAVVNMVNQISFPGDIEYFAKCQEMYSHIYKDSESPMAQLYAFVPATFWKLDETSYEGGTILTTTAGEMLKNGNIRTSQTMGVKLTELKEQIQALLDSSTFNFIYADILRMVDPSKLLTMPYIVEGEFIEPEYDPMMLLQINNLNVVGMPAGALGENTTPDNDVYPVPDNNAIKYAPQFNQQRSYNVERTIINFPHSMGNPDVDQKVESTRMVTLGIIADGITEDAAVPDHYCVGFRVVNGFQDDQLQVWWTSYPLSTSTNLMNWIKHISDLMKFDYCPRFYNLDAETYKVLDVIGDLDYFTDIDFRYLKRVNDLAYTHLFEIPSIEAARK